MPRIPGETNLYSTDVPSAPMPTVGEGAYTAQALTQLGARVADIGFDYVEKFKKQEDEYESTKLLGKFNEESTLKMEELKTSSKDGYVWTLDEKGEAVREKSKSGTGFKTIDEAYEEWSTDKLKEKMSTLPSDNAKVAFQLSATSTASKSKALMQIEGRKLRIDQLEGDFRDTVDRKASQMLVSIPSSSTDLYEAARDIQALGLRSAGVWINPTKVDKEVKDAWNKLAYEKFQAKLDHIKNLNKDTSNKGARKVNSAKLVNQVLSELRGEYGESLYDETLRTSAGLPKKEDMLKPEVRKSLIDEAMALKTMASNRDSDDILRNIKTVAGYIKSGKGSMSEVATVLEQVRSAQADGHWSADKAAQSVEEIWEAVVTSRVFKNPEYTGTTDINRQGKVRQKVEQEVEALRNSFLKSLPEKPTVRPGGQETFSIKNLLDAAEEKITKMRRENPVEFIISSESNLVSPQTRVAYNQIDWKDQNSINKNMRLIQSVNDMAARQSSSNKDPSYTFSPLPPGASKQIGEYLSSYSTSGVKGTENNKAIDVPGYLMSLQNALGRHYQAGLSKAIQDSNASPMWNFAGMLYSPNKDTFRSNIEDVSALIKLSQPGKDGKLAKEIIPDGMKSDLKSVVSDLERDMKPMLEAVTRSRPYEMLPDTATLFQIMETKALQQLQMGRSKEQAKESARALLNNNFKVIDTGSKFFGPGEKAKLLVPAGHDANQIRLFTEEALKDEARMDELKIAVPAGPNGSVSKWSDNARAQQRRTGYFATSPDMMGLRFYYYNEDKNRYEPAATYETVTDKKTKKQSTVMSKDAFFIPWSGVYKYVKKYNVKPENVPQTFNPEVIRGTKQQ